MADAPMGSPTAIVTGANHGIGAATALAFGQRGCAVLCAFLRIDDPADPGTPQAHRDRRRQDAGPLATQIEVAEIIACLASDAAALITANVITLR